MLKTSVVELAFRVVHLIWTVPDDSLTLRVPERDKALLRSILVGGVCNGFAEVREELALEKMS